MALVQEYEKLITAVQENQSYLRDKTNLYEINEGNLLPHVLKALNQQFSPNTFEQMTFRVPPINILKQVIDKLSKIYQPGPTRAVVNGNETDMELLAWYQKVMKMNRQMNLSNEYFNLFKNQLIHICLVRGVPTLRPIPSDRFFVFGMDPLDPMRVTHVVLLMGKRETVNKTASQKMTQIYAIYTDNEFIVAEDGHLRPDLMEEYGNPTGLNIFGKLPFVYVTRSANELIPLPDTDTYSMSLIIPEAFTDLNAGVMFQIFSIFYGIDLTEENLVYSPNAFWRFKTDPNRETKPEVGILKPSVDVSQALSLIQAELSLWLQSLGIRPGSVGTLTTDNFASGISKLVDEMDTTDHKLKQIGFYCEAEAEIWDFIIHYAHPIWTDLNLIEETRKWSPEVQIQVNYADQIPMQSRGEIVDELVKELGARLTTKRRALKRLNPEMTDVEVDELISEIENESFLGGLLNAQAQGQQGQQAQAESQNPDQPDGNPQDGQDYQA